MKTGFKKFLSLGALTTILMGFSQISYARNIGNYDTKVPTFNDYESRSLIKTNNTDAINNCTGISNGKIRSWVEDEDGNNITAQVTYSKPGVRAMGYSNADAYLKDSVRLNLSTSIGTWSSVDTVGTWSPDNK